MCVRVCVCAYTCACTPATFKLSQGEGRKEGGREQKQILEEGPRDPGYSRVQPLPCPPLDRLFLSPSLTQSFCYPPSHTHSPPCCLAVRTLHNDRGMPTLSSAPGRPAFPCGWPQTWLPWVWPQGSLDQLSSRAASRWPRQFCGFAWPPLTSRAHPSQKAAVRGGVCPCPLCPVGRGKTRP